MKFHWLKEYCALDSEKPKWVKHSLSLVVFLKKSNEKMEKSTIIIVLVSSSKRAVLTLQTYY